MNFRCDNCGTTTEVKISDNCPQCGSEKFRPIKESEKLYLKSIKSADSLQKIGISISVIMIITGIIGIFAGLAIGIHILIPSILLVVNCTTPIDIFNSKALMLKNVAEINKKLK